MRETYAPAGPAVSPAKANGAAGKSYTRAAVLDRRNGRGLKGKNGVSKARALPAAPLARVEVSPADQPGWPLHPVAWFQPELQPQLPPSSGLVVDRQQRIPAPGFAPLDVTPITPVRVAGEGGEPRPPQLPSQLPQSALGPLGWDPRPHALPGGKS